MLKSDEKCCIINFMNVYDFDNTIYDGESIWDFFKSYIRVNPSFVRYMPRVIFAFAKYKLGKLTVEQMLRDYAPVIKKCYCDYGNWEEFTVKFWDEHMHKIKDFYSDIRRDDDVILTASPDITMREISNRLGIKYCVCSTVDHDTGEITRLCMRQNKITALKEEFGEDVCIDDFYTDSIANDGFFAEHAKRVFLVKGDKLTRIK